jgi:cytochrome oxidase Cu insertion factor (SCO1/SenC/PrrC family)
VAILGITAVWWALALWSVGEEPEWLARTRAACFGSARGGLPDVRGWILLVGEPLGMLGMLMAGWRQSLTRDLRRVMAYRWGRVAGLGTVALMIAGIWTAGVRVRRALDEPFVTSDGTVVQKRLDMEAPAMSLTDQHGRLTTFADFRGHTVLLTFAFGHCSTVCPVIASALRSARDQAHRPDVPIVIITLDPWRDTPDRLQTIAEGWGLGAEDRVLSGDVADVERILDALGVGRQRDERTGDVTHGQTVLGINALGRITWRADGGWSGVEQFLRRS